MSGPATQTFTITVQPSGSSFACAANADLLGAGLASGRSLRYSCRSGVCRTCRARLIAGKVDYGPVHPNYLSSADKAAGFVHLCCAKPLSDCTLEAHEIDLGQAPATEFPVRVMSLQRLAPDVMQVVVRLPPNEPLQFLAGQYVDVMLADGLHRSYSIASAPTTQGLRQIELHIRHMPGGVFTDRVFGQLKVRDLLRLQAPRGYFRIDEGSALPMVMVASGTGFAPIKSMVEHGLQKGMQRPVHLYWGGRKRADLYLHEMALDWVQAYPHIKYTPVLSDATPECQWIGRRGLVHQAVMQDFSNLNQCQVYASGAPVMVDAARSDFGRWCGLPADQFFADSFVTQADRALSPAIA
jgi:CDP-4-dehydro-6-deoxyglucose reductase, E3